MFYSARTLFKRWFIRELAGKNRKLRAAAARRRCPGLERLEERTLLTVNPLLSFKGMDTFTAGAIVEPPDPMGAAGPNQVVEIVNSNIAIYDKATGTQRSTEPLDTFFAPVDSIDSLFSDVYVAYDESVGRFFVSTMDIDFFNLQSYFNFAISKDSNPLDGFTEMHQINTTEIDPTTQETLFTDFPRFGMNADAYTISFNMFGFVTENQYNEKILTIGKSSVLDQNDTTLTSFQVDRPLPNSTMVPATMHGATVGGPQWFVEEKGLELNGGYQYLRVVKETNELTSTPTFTDYYVKVAPYTITPFPQDPSNQITTTLDTRILSVDWRAGKMVATQNVGLPGDIDVHARWYQISTTGTSPALLQQGTISPGFGVDTYMPSAAINANGDIGMTYQESSFTENMGVYVTGRLATDPLGAMQAPVLIKAGEQSYQGTRTGDFSGLAVDPSDNTSFWAINEYALLDANIADPNWGTWIGHFSISGAGPFAITNPPGHHKKIRDHRLAVQKAAEILHLASGEPRKNQAILTTPVPENTSLTPHHRLPGGPVIPIGGVTPNVLNAGISFKGLDTIDAGGFIEPPDPSVAAGPGQVVEIVNSNIAIYDKATGARLSQEPLDSFFASVDTVDSLFSDVYVAYDESVGRFIVYTMDIDFFNLQSYFNFAVSNDSNPLHGFTEMHQITDTEIDPTTLETLFTDFPRLGWNADAYVINFNMYGFLTEYPYNDQILIIKKSTVLDQNNATLTSTLLDRPLPNSTMVPATMHGSVSGDPIWFVEEKGLEQNGSYANLRVVKMTNVLSATPTFTDYYVPMAAYTITPFPADPTIQVTTQLDTRILSADMRNGNLVVAQDVGLPGDIDVHARWYELSVAGGTPTMVQQGSVNPGAGIDTYMPSAALDANGSIGITYIESSLTENMSMYVAGRTSYEAQGTLETPILIKAGDQGYQGTRAGDFSQVSVDPVNGTFWAVNEYAILDATITDPNWGTWISNFKVVSTRATRTWSGAGLTNHWTDPNNWVGGVAPNPGDFLVFGSGATQLTSVNDFLAGTQFGSITFTSSGYTLTGNALQLNLGLDASQATGTNTVNINVSLTANESFTMGAAATDIIMAGPLNNAGFILTVNGGSGEMDFANVLKGSGAMILSDAGTVVLSGSSSNTLSGTTTVQSGTLLLNKSAGNALAGNLVLGPGPVVARLLNSNQISDSARVTVNSGALMDFNNFSDKVGSVVLSSASLTTETGTLILGGGVTDSGSSLLSGHIDLGASTRSFTVNSGGLLTVDAPIIGAGGLTKSGPGTLALLRANSYTGTTTLAAGTLVLYDNQSTGTGMLALGSGVLSSGSGPLTIANTLTLTGNTTLAGSSALVFTGPATLTGNRTLTVTNTASVTMSGAIGQTVGLIFGLTKAGAGTLILSAVNTYTGPTTLSGGQFVVTGSLSGSAVTVKSGGVLAGSGVVGPVTVNPGGKVSPGFPAGASAVLTMGNLVVPAAATLVFDWNGTVAGASYDQVAVNGTVNLTGSTMSLNLGYAPAVGDSIVLVNNDGVDPVIGTFAGLAQNATFVLNGFTFQINYAGGDGNDVVVTRIG